MNILILGGTGFIGHFLARKLKKEGHNIIVADIQKHRYGQRDYANYYVTTDLRSIKACKNVFDSLEYDEVYSLACMMGGAGFIFTGDNDADIMHDSALINLNIAECLKNTKSKVFYSSSACIYPKHNQLDPNNPNCAENTAYPADPDSPYGLEKIFSESLYETYHRNYGVDIRIARFHNIFGSEGCYNNGKEKAPAAICRKVAEADKEIEVWGDGLQTRSFLYIDECLDGIERLMNSDCTFPLNIGSDEMISINDLAKMVIDISGKDLKIKNIKGAEGVRGRNSDNKLIYETLGWKPTRPLREGMENLYSWINKQVNG